MRLPFSVVGVLGLWLAWMPVADAQPTYKFQHLTVQDGLAQSSVNAITQDALGFMWFGTNDGLTRFDGYRTTNVQPDPSDSLTIHDHVVMSLLSRGDRYLWIGMRQGGIRRLDLRTFSVEQIPFTGHSSSTPNDRVVQILNDRTGTIWAMTLHSLWRFDSSGGTFVPFDRIPAKDFFFTGMAEESDGTLWIGSNGGGLFRIAPDRREVTPIAIAIPHVPAAELRQIVRVVIDHRGRLLLGTPTVLAGFSDLGPHRQRGDILRATSVEPLAAPYTILDDGHRLWFVSSSQVISVVDLATGAINGVQHDPLIPASLSPGNMISAYVDRSGIAWFGSNGYGVNRVSTAHQRFQTLTLDAPLSFRSIRTILKDRQGALWIGGYAYKGNAGLDRVDNGGVRHFTLGDGPWQLPFPSVWSIVQDPSANSPLMWLGVGTKVVALNSRSGRIEQTMSLPSKAGGTRVIYRHVNGELWAGSQVGIYRWDRTRSQFVEIEIDTVATTPAARRVLRTGETMHMTVLQSYPGLLWFATLDGLICYDIDTHAAVLFVQGWGTDRLGSSAVLSILEDRRGRTWVSTGGAGFARMTIDTSRGHRVPAVDDVTFRSYTSRDGLPNEYVYGILEGDDGALWMSTNRGLVRFDPETERFRNYDAADGLQDNEFNSSAFCRSRDGELFFGGVIGVNRFFPARLQDNPHPPEIVITECRLLDQPLSSPLAVPFLDEIVLEHTDRAITFEFVALEYAAPERNQYRYLLEGFDHRWIEAGSARTATYTNLEPGTYLFRVTGSNNDGIWNPTGASIRLVVLPPIWKTLWFRAIVVLSIVGLWFAGVWYRGRLLAARNSELEARVRERTAEWEAVNSELEAFSYTVSHDLRAPVRAINGYSRMLMEEHSAQISPEAQRMLGVIASRTKRMGDMIDDLLTFSRTGRQTIVHTTIDMTELARTAAAELSPSDGRITINVNSLPSVQGDGTLLRQVWINLLSNAIKFSSGSERPTVTVSGRLEAATAVYSVTDNGVGFDMTYQHKLFGVFERLHSQEEFEGTGVGLAIVARVIKRHGGRIWATGQPGQGATFSFELPLYPPPSI